MNKLKHSLRITAFFGILLAFGSGPLSAQNIPGPSIGIVDVQKVLRDSKASKSVRPVMDGMQKEFQKQVSAQEQRLRQAEQELGRQRAVLAPETFAQKRRAFSDEARKTQVQVKTRRRELDRAFNNTKNVILKRMIVVAQKIAEQKKLNILIEKRFVFLSAKTLDVTEEVIAQLDKELPKIEIDFGQPGKGAEKGKK